MAQPSYLSLLKEARKTRKTLPPEVRGLCAIAAGLLYKSLEKRGIRSTLLVTEEVEFSHVFLKVPNVRGHGDMLLDVTASQFEKERDIEIRPLEGLDMEKFYWWNDPQEVATPSELRRLQEEAGWPPDQWIMP